MLLLLGALAWFALSLLLDLVPSEEHQERLYLAEDGAKLLGIAHWCAFFVRRSFHRLSGLLPLRESAIAIPLIATIRTFLWPAPAPAPRNRAPAAHVTDVDPDVEPEPNIGG